MKVKLLQYTPLTNCATGIRMCWNSENKSDTEEYVTNWVADTGWVMMDDMSEAMFAEAYPENPNCNGDLPEAGPKDKALIDRVANKQQHTSVLRHLNYTFRIECSTKTLLAFTRHKAGVEFSVQSTRFTTKKRKDSLEVTYTKNDKVNTHLDRIMVIVQEAIADGADNDDLSMLLPQGYNYTLQVTMNAQAIQHFLKLRTTKHAHWDIRAVANEIYNQLPEEHKYLYKEFLSEQ